MENNDKKRESLYAKLVDPYILKMALLYAIDPICTPLMPLSVDVC